MCDAKEAKAKEFRRVLLRTDESIKRRELGVQFEDVDNCIFGIRV